MKLQCHITHPRAKIVSVILSSLLILQEEMVVNHIVHHHAHTHKVKEWSQTTILHMDVLGLVSLDSLTELLGN